MTMDMEWYGWMDRWIVAGKCRGDTFDARRYSRAISRSSSESDWWDAIFEVVL